MKSWFGAGASACGVHGSEYPFTTSTGFLSAITSDQMPCSELPLINYVQSHMLGSRFWLLFLTLFTVKIMVFYLSFKYVLKHCYLSGKGIHTCNKWSQLMLVCMWPVIPAPKILASSPDFPPGRLCPVFGYCIWLRVKKKSQLFILIGGKMNFAKF